MARKCSTHGTKESSDASRATSPIGLFAVGKAGKESGTKLSQRFILDASPGNGSIKSAPNPQIHDPRSLRKIILSKDEEWTMGTTDLSGPFYSLKFSVVMEGLQSLPPLFIDPSAPIGGKYRLPFPTLCVTSMGIQHSSTITQDLHHQL